MKPDTPPELLTEFVKSLVAGDKKSTIEAKASGLKDWIGTAGNLATVADLVIANWPYIAGTLAVIPNLF